MLQKVIKFIRQQDAFAFSPSLGFNIKKKFTTIPGGIFSIVFSIFTYWLWFSQLSKMYNLQEPNVITFEDHIDLDKLGNTNLNEMKTLPFVTLRYKGRYLMNDKKDDHDLFTKYLKI